eukprot:scaffold25842_cov45-Phaeocystis_antarctica.AAC.1
MPERRLEHLVCTARRLALEALEESRTHLATRVLEPLLSGWAPLRGAWQGGRQTAHATGLARGLEARDNRKSTSDWATANGARSAGGVVLLAPAAHRPTL